MSITRLPAELIIRILYYTPIQTIIALSLTSAAFYDLVFANENAIYQAAAKFHGFDGTPRASSASQFINNENKECGINGWLDDVCSWKELCRRHFLLEYSWTGKLGDCDLPLKFLWPSVLSNVHQVVIDRLERTAICSSNAGGLIAVAIDTGEKLWQLPTDYIARYAHIEHDHGFLVFPRGNDHLEVWRRSADYFIPESHLPSWPHPSQTAVSPYKLAASTMDSLLPTESPTGDGSKPELSSPLRGVYLPFALLPAPARARVFRLAHPYLIAADETRQKAYVWDVTHAALIRTVNISLPSLRILDRIYFIDAKENLVVICWTRSFAVYRGLTDDESVGTPPEVIFSMSWEREQPAAAGFISDIYSVETTPSEPPEINIPKERTTTARRRAVQRCDAIESEWDRYSAALLSPNGQDLVVVTWQGSLLYIPEFASNSHGGRALRQPLWMKFRTGLSAGRAPDLAFDGNRILLSIDSGICSIAVKDPRHRDCSRLHQIPEVFHITRTNPSARVFGAIRDERSNIEIYNGAVWFTHPAPRDLDFAASHLASVDLTAAIPR